MGFDFNEFIRPNFRQEHFIHSQSSSFVRTYTVRSTHGLNKLFEITSQAYILRTKFLSFIILLTLNASDNVTARGRP